MVRSNINTTFNCDIKKVWNIVTSLENYSWRSDLAKIEVLSEEKFVEYTKDGYKTKFAITVIEPYKCWAFDIENDNISGHWSGIFSGDENQCTADFTEGVTAKRIIMRPFIKGYLKKQQQTYITDLKKALEV